jgi:hypothetical protein
VNNKMGRLGFEPRANALKGRCSTAELPTHGQKTGQWYHVPVYVSTMLRSGVASLILLSGPIFLAATPVFALQDEGSRSQVRAEQRRQQRRAGYRSYFSDDTQKSDGFATAQQITDLRRSGRNKLWIPEGLENRDNWLRWSVNGISPWNRWLGWYREERPEDAPLTGTGADLSLEDPLTLLRGEKRTTAELHRVRTVVGGGSKSAPGLPGLRNSKR